MHHYTFLQIVLTLQATQDGFNILRTLSFKVETVAEFMLENKLACGRK